MSSALDILDLLQKSTIPIFTYVNDDAGSAGALIALGSKNIYMAPVSAIGAAAPVMEGGQDVPETMNQKIVSYYSGYFRSAAEKNGYNPLIAQAFIDKDTEVKIGQTVINPKGKLLTLSAQEAVKKYDGKPLLATGIASSVDDLLKQAALTGQIVNVQPSGFERIAFFITMLSPFLMMAGIIAAYIEFKTPGIGIAGFISAVCFLLFFAGHYIAGLTGFEVVVIFFLGLVLILTEIFFFPGTLVVALVGVFLMIGSLLFAMVDHFPGQPVVPSMEMLYMPTLNLLIAFILASVCIVILARFLPDIPILNRIILKTQQAAGPSYESTTVSGVARLMNGQKGIAVTILRPAGKAQFDGQLADVVTEGGFIDPGTRICIVNAGSDRVVVRAV